MASSVTNASAQYDDVEEEEEEDLGELVIEPEPEPVKRTKKTGYLKREKITAAPAKKKGKKRVRKATKNDDEEEEMIVAIDASPLPPKKISKSRNHKKQKAFSSPVQSVEDDDDEKEEVDDASSSSAESKKTKRERKHHAVGSRFQTAPVFRTRIKKERERKRKEAEEAGREYTRRRTRPGAVVSREIAFLQQTNGLYIPSAIVKRQMKEELSSLIPVVRAEFEPIANRLRERGKPVPALLNVNDPSEWYISPAAVELVRAAVQIKLEDVASTADMLRRKDGRKTVLLEDVVYARAFTHNK